MIEFYEDHFEAHPEEARKHVAGDGEFYFTETGDDLIDKWERELSQGLQPDLEEGMSAQAKARLQTEKQKHSKPAPPKDDPRLRSKFVRPGSQEEAALRKSKTVSKTDVWTDLLHDVNDNGS